MANKATLTIGSESFDLLSYHNHFFYPNPCDRMFYHSTLFEDISDPIGVFGSWYKYNCWKYDLLKGYDHPSLYCNAFKPKSNLFGGVFTFTIESAGREDVFEHCVSSRKDHGTPILHGEVKFFDSKEEDAPFQRFEFWDGFVCNLSESFCSTSSKPMTMQVTISPATIRVNKSIVFQQNWWQTDIGSKGGKASDEGEREPFVKRIFWKGREKAQERKDMMLNHNIKLQIELSNYIQGDSVELVVKQSKGRRIKGESVEFAINGMADENGLVIIENFKVECDFKEDNRNFGMIEFYHKDRKVDEFKENFGWTWIKDGHLLKIFTNIEVNIDYLAAGCTEEDYKNAVNNQFKRTLELSSGGLITGKLFFNGIYVNDPPQVVPKLDVIKEYLASEGYSSTGTNTSGVYMSVESAHVDDSFLLTELAEGAVHELFHTLRLHHPFSLTQAEDTTLINVGWEHLQSTPKTDSKIAYNIMFYNIKYVDGAHLNELWVHQRPEYITKGQLRFVFDEIDRQQKGRGTVQNVEIGSHEEAPWMIYWDPDRFPGRPLMERINSNNKPKE